MKLNKLLLIVSLLLTLLSCNTNNDDSEIENSLDKGFNLGSSGMENAIIKITYDVGSSIETINKLRDEYISEMSCCMSDEIFFSNDELYQNLSSENDIDFEIISGIFGEGINFYSVNGPFYAPELHDSLPLESHSELWIIEATISFPPQGGIEGGDL